MDQADPPALPRTLAADAMRARKYRMARTVMALILREMSTTYGRSPGGYLWAILEPVMALTLLVFLFSLFLRSPSLGNSFALFYASGFLPFMAFNDTANKIATCVRYSKPLLEYPVVTYFDSMLARLLLTLFSHLVIGIIICTAILVVQDTRAHLTPGAIVLSIVMVASLGFGVGTMNCFLMTAFPVWERFWTIFTRPLMLASGIFFTYHDMPQQVQAFIWYNPIIHVVGKMREGFYMGYWGDYISPGYVFGLSLSLAVIGMVLLNRHNRKMMNEM